MPESRFNPRKLIPLADRRVAAVLLAALKSAPRWGQIAVAAAVLGVAAMTTIALLGLGSTDVPGVRQQLLSIIIAHTGLLLLGIALFLYRLTQSPTRWRALARRPSGLGSPRMHALLLALPMVSFVAGIMLTAATALLIPSMTSPAGGPFILMGAMYVAVVFMAGRAVRQTTRFMYRYARQQSEAVARAERQVNHARVAALQAQMNPHFLFNALNTVAALIRQAPDRAERTVEDLAAVLRRTLDRSETRSTTLAEEVDYVRHYLAIEHERFGDRLSVTWDVDDETGTSVLPPMTLQPIVENAIKYGLGATLNPCRITVSAHLRHGWLDLAVHDDGPGFPPGHREGTGLSNLRTRLDTLSEGKAELVIESHPGNTTIMMSIPQNGQEQT